VEVIERERGGEGETEIERERERGVNRSVRCSRA